MEEKMKKFLKNNFEELVFFEDEFMKFVFELHKLGFSTREIPVDPYKPVFIAEKGDEKIFATHSFGYEEDGSRFELLLPSTEEKFKEYDLQ